MPSNTILCILLISLVFPAQNKGFDVFDYDEDIDMSNKYIDKLLQNVLSENKYNPFLLKPLDLTYNSTEEASFKPLIGQFRLTNGYIESAKSSIHRQYDCSIKHSGDKLLISSSVEIEPLRFHYDGTFEFLGNALREAFVIIKAKLDYVKAGIEIAVDESTGLNGKIIKFDLKNMRDLSIEVRGLRNMEYIIAGLKQWMTVEFELSVVDLLENMKIDFAKNLLQIPFPGNL